MEMVASEPRSRRIILAAALPVLLAVWALPAFGNDLVLALDRSGSMQVYDPDHESLRGAELFIALLPGDQRLALMTFAESTELLRPFGALRDPGARASVTRLTQGIAMTGALTNFEAALRAAYDLHTEAARSTAAPRDLILFTDGQIDVGSYTANRASERTIFDDLLPKFQTAGIRIHGIAFSQWSDLGLLQRMAEATGGQAVRAETAADIQAAFVRLFETAGDSTSMPIVNGRVQVDSSVDQLSLLVKRDTPDERIRVTDPSGHTIAAADADAGVTWTSTGHFDHVQVNRPAAGAWTITGSTGEKKAWIVSDIQLYTHIAAWVRVGASTTLTARLVDQQGQPADPALFREARFSVAVHDPSGQLAQTLTPTTHSIAPDPGAAAAGSPARAAAAPARSKTQGFRWEQLGQLFNFYADDRVREVRGELTFPEPGVWRLRVTADTSLFQRTRDLFISVLADAPAAQPPPVFQPQPLPASPLRIQTEPPRTAAAPRRETPPSEPPPPDGSGIATGWTAFLLLIAANLVLLPLGVLGFWFWRRRRRDRARHAEP